MRPFPHSPINGTRHSEDPPGPTADDPHFLGSSPTLFPGDAPPFAALPPPPLGDDRREVSALNGDRTLPVEAAEVAAPEPPALNHRRKNSGFKTKRSTANAAAAEAVREKKEATAWDATIVATLASDRAANGREVGGFAVAGDEGVWAGGGNRTVECEVEKGGRAKMTSSDEAAIPDGEDRWGTPRSIAALDTAEPEVPAAAGNAFAAVKAAAAASAVAS